MNVAAGSVQRHRIAPDPKAKKERIDELIRAKAVEMCEEGNTAVSRQKSSHSSPILSYHKSCVRPTAYLKLMPTHVNRQ